MVQMYASVASGQATPRGRGARGRAPRPPLLPLSAARRGPAHVRRTGAACPSPPPPTGRMSAPQPNWLVRLFDWKPFLVFMCMLPAVGLLLVFLTYPLGLGIWLAFTDTTIGRSGAVGRHREFRVPDGRPDLLERGVLQRLLHGGRHGREIRPRPVAGAAAEQPPAVQEHAPRHHPAALDRADRALGHRLLVDLRPAVLASSPTCSWTCSGWWTATSTSSAPPGRRASR